MASTLFRSLRWLAGSSILAWAAVSAASEPGSMASEPGSALRFDHFGPEQGLSDGTVEAILEDHRGFLWFGTPDGLNRYDGYDFTVYRHDPTDPRSPSRSYITSLLEDRSGELWIGTLGGLDRYVRETDSFERVGAGGDGEGHRFEAVVNFLFQDRSGHLWVGSNRGLDRWDPETGTLVPYLARALAELRADTIRVRTIAEDRSGFLWVGTEGGGLLRMDPRNEEFEHFRHDPDDPASLCHDDIRALLSDRRGRLWIATRGGLDRLDDPDTRGHPGAFRHVVPDPDDPGSPGGLHVDVLFEDRSGRLWIGYDGAGIDRFDEASGIFHHYRSLESDSTSLSGDVVRTIYEDRRGDLWIGTYTNGLNHLDRQNPFFYERHRQGDSGSLVNSAVLSFFEDPDGTLWVGTEGGLHRRGPGAERFEAFVHDENDPRSLGADAVLSILRDRRGRLWVGTFYGGLGRMVSDEGRFVSYRPEPGSRSGESRGPGSLHVWDLLEDRQGRLWLATFDGVDRLDPRTGVFTHFRHDPEDENSLGNQLAWDLLEDREGILWLATQGGLVAHDPATGTFRTFDRRSGLPSDAVLTLHEGQGGVLWLGLEEEGLVRFDIEQETFTPFGVGGERASRVVYCLLEDGEGWLWASLDDGLARFDPDVSSFAHFDRSDGTLAAPFSKGGCLRTRDGQLLFGGRNGLNRFDPSAIPTTVRPPPVVLTDFRIFNEPVAIGGEDSPLRRSITEAKEIRLRHEQSVIGFTFAALDFRAPEKLRYAYLLEGFDEDWNLVGPQRSATYTNLDPGEYVFRARGAVGAPTEAAREASVKVVVEPPPWLTWWAKGLYILGLGALVFAFVASQRQRVERERAISRRLRAVDKVKDRFLASTSHELRTPLFDMIGLAESLAEGGEALRDSTVKANLERIIASGRRLGALVDDVLDFVRLKEQDLVLRCSSVDLRALADVVVTLLRPLARARGTELINGIPEGLPPARADEDRVQQILFGLVGNAIGLTAEGRVEIGAGLDEEDDRHLRITVRLTGFGIAQDQQERIFQVFEQAEDAEEGASSGTGLGLAVTRQLVELHGGRVGARSRLGEGSSTFWLTLPVSDGASPEPRPSEGAAIRSGLPRARRSPDFRGFETPSPEPGPVGSRASILVVDDELENRRVLSNHLGSAGYRVELAADGPEALDRLRSRRYDLVLLDVMMPRMSGYEVCRTLRLDASKEELPVLFLTTRARVPDLVTGLEAGGNDYLVKPIGRDELLARVETHLELLSVHRDLERLVEERLAQIKILKGLLPICAVCKKIRDDEGYWSDLEEYLGEHSEAQALQGLCSDCTAKPVPGGLGDSATRDRDARLS